MKKKIFSIFIILFICSFFIGVSAAAGEGDSDAGVKFNDSGLQTTLEQAQKENKQVLIDFYSPT